MMDDNERSFWASNPHPATHAAAAKFFRERREREKLKEEILKELRAEPES